MGAMGVGAYKRSFLGFILLMIFGILSCFTDLHNL